jgi:predicted transcriptional regulator of viral defense system
MNVQGINIGDADLFKEKQVVSWTDLLSCYAPSGIHNLVKRGQIVKLAHGRYALPDFMESSEYTSWAFVAQKSPKGVVCLASALKFHGITLQNPHELWWAIPQGYNPPTVEFPTLRVVRLSSPSIEEGVEEVVVDSMKMRVFNISKTVADCFKFRNKIGLNIAIEALSDSWEKKLLDLNLLWKYAEMNRVQRVMQPYLDSLR